MQGAQRHPPWMEFVERLESLLQGATSLTADWHCASSDSDRSGARRRMQREAATISSAAHNVLMFARHSRVDTHILHLLNEHLARGGIEDWDWVVGPQAAAGILTLSTELSLRYSGQGRDERERRASPSTVSSHRRRPSEATIQKERGIQRVLAAFECEPNHMLPEDEMRRHYGSNGVPSHYLAHILSKVGDDPNFVPPEGTQTVADIIAGAEFVSMFDERPFYKPIYGDGGRD